MTELPGMYAAARQFVEERVFPLIHILGDKRAHVLGTGFLVQDGGAFYLLTARHVLEETKDVSYDHIAFPLRGPESDVYRLPDVPYLSSPGAGADIAVVSLGYETKELRKLHWKSFTLESFLVNRDVEDDETVLVYGYPRQLQPSTEADPNLGVGVVGLRTKRYGGDHSAIPKYVPEIDIVFEHPKTMMTDSVEKDVPNLNGISGSAMFCFDDVTGGFWTAERGLKIVGVQKTVLRGTYIRATRSKYVARSLEHLFDDIRTGKA